MTDRQRLPDRRGSETFSLQCAGLNYTATVSHFNDGRLAEIFLSNHKAEVTPIPQRATRLSLAASPCNSAPTLRQSARRYVVTPAGMPAGRSVPRSTCSRHSHDQPRPYRSSFGRAAGEAVRHARLRARWRASKRRGDGRLPCAVPWPNLARHHRAVAGPARPLDAFAIRRN